MATIKNELNDKTIKFVCGTDAAEMGLITTHQAVDNLYLQINDNMRGILEPFQSREIGNDVFCSTAIVGGKLDASTVCTATSTALGNIAVRYDNGEAACYAAQN